jgi:steroid delta-isomerase-like uncharacterized protein
MAPEEIKAVITKMQEDTCNGNLDAIYQYISDDYIFHRTPLPDTVGREANRKGDEAMLVAFTDNRMTIHEIVVEGNTAVMHYTWQALHTGATPSLGIPPTGKEVKLSGCMIYHWVEDQIVEQWDYTDMLSLMQQLGLIPAPG